MAQFRAFLKEDAPDVRQRRTMDYGRSREYMGSFKPVRVVRQTGTQRQQAIEQSLRAEGWTVSSHAVEGGTVIEGTRP